MHVVAKTVKGHEYFYLVEKGREGGKVVTTRTIYIGDRKKLAALVQQSAAAALPTSFRPQSVGAALALATLASELGLEELIDDVCPTRAGAAPVGRRLVLAAIHRALALKGENGLTNLATWYAGSVLEEVTPIGLEALNGRRLGVLFKRLSTKELDRIEDAVVGRLIQHERLGLRALAFDCTNFDSYADAKTKSRLLKRGHGKSGKPLKVLGLGLLASDEGVPLLSFAYPGNENDVTAFARFLKTLDRRCAGLKLPLDATIAADGGNISKQILLRLEKDQRAYVLRLPPKHLVAMERLATAKLPALGGALAGKVWAHKQTCDLYGVSRCIVDQYSRRMHRRQLPGLERDRRKARADLEHLQRQLQKQRAGQRHAAPLTETSLQRRVKAALEREHMTALFTAGVTSAPDGHPVLTFTENVAAWKHLQTHHLGRTLLVTNRSEWSPEQIVQASRVQSHNENIFKDLKDPAGVSMLPLRHRKDQALRTHALIVVLGLMLARLLQRRVQRAGVRAASLKSVMSPLKEVSRARVTMPDDAQPALKALAASTWIPSERTPRQAAILQALGLANRIELGTTLADAVSAKKTGKRRKQAPQQGNSR